MRRSLALNFSVVDTPDNNIFQWFLLFNELKTKIYKNKKFMFTFHIQIFIFCCCTSINVNPHVHFIKDKLQHIFYIVTVYLIILRTFLVVTEM